VRSDRPGWRMKAGPGSTDHRRTTPCFQCTTDPRETKVMGSARKGITAAHPVRLPATRARVREALADECCRSRGLASESVGHPHTEARVDRQVGRLRHGTGGMPDFLNLLRETMVIPSGLKAASGRAEQRSCDPLLPVLISLTQGSGLDLHDRGRIRRDRWSTGPTG
jgi:hypothetical protein